MESSVTQEQYKPIQISEPTQKVAIVLNIHKPMVMLNTKLWTYPKLIRENLTPYLCMTWLYRSDRYVPSDNYLTDMLLHDDKVAEQWSDADELCMSDLEQFAEQTDEEIAKALVTLTGMTLADCHQYLDDVHLSMFTDPWHGLFVPNNSND